MGVLSRSSLDVKAEYFGGGRVGKAEYMGGGKRLCPRKLEVGKVLGEGSYGMVYEVRRQSFFLSRSLGPRRPLLVSFHCTSQGILTTSRGEKQRVVLKRVKADVEVGWETGGLPVRNRATALKQAAWMRRLLGICERLKFWR